MSIAHAMVMIARAFALNTNTRGRSPPIEAVPSQKTCNTSDGGVSW
jgi:hypothetical protein